MVLEQPATLSPCHIVRLQIGHANIKSIFGRLEITNGLRDTIRANQALCAVITRIGPCRFAERHRKLLNALLRQHPSLLEGTLAPLLRAARLVDFDNKRAYFRTKVRSHTSDRHYGSLKINVRREHVFEDSFHQLRVR